MRKKQLFVYNPNAGTKKIREKLNDVVLELVEEDCDLVICPTRKKGDAAELVMAYMEEGDCCKVITSGGDGTLHDIINGMMRTEYEKRVPIVYIPAGSTNDFAYTLNLPSNVVEAAKLSKSGYTFECDIAQFNEKYFVYTAAFGLFTDLSYATPQNLKNVFGHAAYVINGAGSLARMKKYRMTVRMNGREITDDFVYGMVVSSESIGGIRGITGPDVKLNDGEYELFLVRDTKPMELPELVNDILRKNFNNPNIVYARVKEVNFSSEAPIPWTLDGEFGGELDDVTIKIYNRAVTFMAPRSILGLFGNDMGQ